MFNGRDLSSWTFHCEDPSARVEDTWSVSGGVLRCTGSPNGYLRTEESFDHFVLSLEWRFAPDKAADNSGVLLRMSGPDKVWPKSIEAQLLDRHAGDIWNIDEFDLDVDRDRTAGRHTEKLWPSNEYAHGAWNHYLITLDGGELTLEVNGLLQNRAAWCAEIEGKICLQSESAPIEFRNLTLIPIERRSE